MSFQLTHYKTLLKSLSALLLVTSATYSLAVFAEGDISGILKQQTAYSIHQPRNSESSWQQNEWQLDLEYNSSIDSGSLSGDLVAIIRGRYDFEDQLEDDSSNTLRIREFYWQTYAENSFWRIGKQQVVWGEADGLKLLDVINPQDFREFILDDFDDSRIPLWMVNAQINTSDSSMLQLLLIPDTSTHKLADKGSTYQFDSPVIVPSIDANNLQALAVEQITIREKDNAPSGDIGLRYSDFIDVLGNSWDVTLNYLYHYVDSPILETSINDNKLLIDYQYKRSHLIGGSASTVLNNITLRSEVAYETDRYQRGERQLETFNMTTPLALKGNLLSTVIGLDYQGLTDHFISMQWYRQTLLLNKKSRETIADRSEDRLTFLWETNYFNETLTTHWQQIHGVNHNDGILRGKITYNWLSNTDIYLGADYFYGSSEEFFGQFNRTDRVLAGFAIGL